MKTEALQPRPEVLAHLPKIAPYFSQFCKENPITGLKLYSLIDHVNQEYAGNGAQSEKDKQFFRKGFELGVYLHGNNGEEEDRYRKVPSVHGDKIPYIEHPMSIAWTHAGSIRILSYMIEGRQYKVPIKEHPLDPVIVVADFVHDTSEDVSINGVENEEWFPLFRAHFGDDRSEKVIKMVQAVTKYKRVDITPELVAEIDSSPIFQQIVQRVVEHIPPATVGTEPDHQDKIKTQIRRSLLDTHKMFTTCFGEQGEDVRDPEALKLFFGAVAIKTGDIENNLQTPGTREEKLIRAHIFAIMARLLGFPVASRLAIHLAMDNQYSINVADDAENKSQWRKMLHMVRRYSVLERRPFQTFVIEDEYPGIGTVRWPLQVSANQIPIITAQEQASAREDRSVDPTIQYLCVIDDSDKRDGKDFAGFEYAMDSARSFSDGTNSYSVIRKFSSPVHQFIAKYGRKSAYYEICDDAGNTKAIIRLRDNKPTAYDVIKKEDAINPLDVPESWLFAQFDGSMESTLRILNIFSPFNEGYIDTTQNQ